MGHQGATGFAFSIVLGAAVMTLGACASSSDGGVCLRSDCADAAPRDLGGVDAATADLGSDGGPADSGADGGVDAGVDGGPVVLGTFCPSDPTSRAQFARFAVRYLRPDFDPSAWIYRGTFSDVPSTHVFAAEIEQLAADGITAGCGDGTTFCPNDPVLRSQASVFVTRILRGPSFTPPPASGDYSDVPSGAFYAPHAEYLGDQGIMNGCGATTFCPTDPLTRQQTAVVFVRMVDGTTPDLPPYRGLFTDVPETNAFARYIERFADLGYTNGC